MVYKACVIGLGNVGAKYDMPPNTLSGNSHAGAIKLNSVTKLCGGADHDQTQREAFAKYFGCPVFDNCENLYNHVQPDIVCVAVPSEHQFSICLSAVKANVKIVICEKPFIKDLKLASEIVELCEKKDVILVVNHWMRWSKKWQKVKQLLDSGSLGSIQKVRYIYSKGVFNSGTHAFDILRYLFGEPIKVVADSAMDIDTGEKNIDGRIFFENDLIISIATLNFQYHFTTECDIIASKGRILIHDRGLDYWNTTTNDGVKFLTPSFVPFSMDEKDFPFIQLLQETIDSFESGKTNIRCTGTDGIKSVLIAKAFMKSFVHGGKEISLKGKINV